MIDIFALASLSTLGSYRNEENNDPKYYHPFGYDQGLIKIGEILFALAPGLSKHGLGEVEEISKSVIREIIDNTSGASCGPGPDETDLPERPYSVGVWRACYDFLKEVDPK